MAAARPSVMPSIQKPKRLEINEAEAAIVKRVFGIYIREGLSHEKIAERLRVEGIRTRHGRKRWYAVHAQRMLNYEGYVGRAFYNKNAAREDWIPIYCPPIITEDEWKAAHSRAKRNRRESQRPRDVATPFLLSGLLKCQPRGGSMFGSTKPVAGMAHERMAGR